MQVTNETFPAVYEHFVSLLQTCDFYAFDEEMTGIADLERTECITDTPEESYLSKRRVAQRYSLIQVGICLFHKVDKEKVCMSEQQQQQQQQQSQMQEQQQHYVARPFTFHIFPDSSDDMTTEAERIRDVVMNPSTLHFLRKHGMNFQSWIYSGIRCCNAQQEMALRKELSQEIDNDKAACTTNINGSLHEMKSKCENKDKLMSLLTDEEQKWVRHGEDEAIKLVQQFDNAMQSITEAKEKTQEQQLTSSTVATTSTPVNVCKEMLLPATNSRAARDALRDIIRLEHPRISMTFRRQGQSIGVLLTVLTETELKMRQEHDALRQRRQLLDTIGFRLIFTALVQSKKPCVGHNCFADLLFLMDTFDAPLPLTLPEWKVRVHELFPALFDTRYLAAHRTLFASSRFPAMYLGGLFKEYGMNSTYVKLTLPLGFESYDPLTLIHRSRGSGNNNNNSSNAFHSTSSTTNSGSLTSAGASSNNDPQHEAGYDALMTGCLLLNLLAELGYKDGIDSTMISELQNRVAVFRSLYAIDITSCDSDEYLAGDVLDLKHEDNISTNQLASCLSTCEQYEAQLYSIDKTRTLAVLPDLGEVNATNLATALSSRYSAHLSASVYKPPHVLNVMKAAVRKIILHR